VDVRDPIGDLAPGLLALPRGVGLFSHHVSCSSIR
jgi:hypothetical protein